MTIGGSGDGDSGDLTCAGCARLRQEKDADAALPTE